MKTKNIMTLLAMLSLLAFAPSCSNDDNGDGGEDLQPIKIECNVVQQTDYAAKSNKFAGKFYGAITSDPEFVGKNFCVSPISMQYLISMLANGVDDEAAVQQVSDVLELGTLDNINTNSKLLLDKLDEDDEFVKTDINNSVWGNVDINFNATFKQAMKTYYDAEFGSLDFFNNSEKAKTEINKWVSDKTDGLIKQLSVNVDKGTDLLLLNAIYFNGKWSDPFKSNDTKAATFYNLDGTSATVNMMNRASAHINQYTDDEMKAVELPYGKGYYTMTIVMPNNSETLDSLALNIDWWQLHQKMTSSTMEIGLPKFKITSNFKKLKGYLPQLGLGRLATSTYMNIGLRADDGLSSVSQDVVISVEENGTQATSASAAEIYLGAELPQSVNFDRPFIYTIRENTTGTILFMGRVVKF